MMRSVTVRWPVELTGKNSVTPSTTPSTTALPVVSSFRAKGAEPRAIAPAAVPNINSPTTAQSIATSQYLNHPACITTKLLEPSTRLRFFPRPDSGYNLDARSRFGSRAHYRQHSSPNVARHDGSRGQRPKIQRTQVPKPLSSSGQTRQLHISLETHGHELAHRHCHRAHREGSEDGRSGDPHSCRCTRRPAIACDGVAACKPRREVDSYASYLWRVACLGRSTAARVAGRAAQRSR